MNNSTITEIGNKTTGQDESKITYLKPCGPPELVKEMDRQLEKYTDLKKNEYKLYKESRDMTTEQKKELVDAFLQFMEQRFGQPFQEITLTNESNFYSSSYLTKCHHFLKCLKPENIYWEKTHFRNSPYGEYSLVAYLSKEDYIEFFHIGGKTTTFRFSFDVMGNTFTLKYPYPVPGSNVECKEYVPNKNQLKEGTPAWHEQKLREKELKEKENENKIKSDNNINGSSSTSLDGSQK